MPIDFDLIIYFNFSLLYHDMESSHQFPRGVFPFLTRPKSHLNSLFLSHLNSIIIILYFTERKVFTDIDTLVPSLYKDSNYLEIKAETSTLLRR